MRTAEERLADEQRLREAQDKHRRTHVNIVYEELRKATAMHTDACRRLAELAVDALLADGVVFARMGPCIDEEDPNTAASVE